MISEQNPSSKCNAVTTIVSMALSELASTPYFIIAARMQRPMQMPDHDI